MLSSNEKLTFLIPVHNEERAIAKTISGAENELKKLNINYEIIVIDDHSADKTPEILKTISNIKIITNPYNLGYGASLKKGIRESSGGWIMIIDADSTYPTDKIADLLKYAGEYDMVVGNRQHTKDYFGRKTAKWILKKMAGFLAGTKIPDLNSGMRVFRKSIALEFFHLFPARFSFTSTITLACYNNDYTIKYVSISYLERVGKSGIRSRHFFDFLALILKIFLYFKPLKMLSPLAFLFLIAGVGKGIRDIIVVSHIGTLASILILISVQIFLLALISEVVIKRGTK